MAGNTKRKNKRGLAFVSIFLLLILAAAGGVSSDKNKDNTTGTTEAVATSEITTEAFAGNDRDVAGRPADTLSGKDDSSDISGDGSGSDVVAPTTESDRPAFVAVPADDSEAYAIINDNMPGFPMRTRSPRNHLKSTVSLMNLEDVVWHMQISARS